MSGPGIVAVMQFAGLAMGGKAVIDGIKEGNIGKAILGGIGAYFSINGLTSGAAAAGQTAGTQATAGLGTDAAQTMATNQAASNVAEQTTGTVASAPAQGTSVADTFANMGKMTAEGSSPMGLPPVASESGGFLSNAGQWMKNNPMLAAGAMQLGGNLAGGYAQGQMMEDQMEEKRKAEEDSRKRREYSADTGFLKRYSYNPNSGWSPTNG